MNVGQKLMEPLIALAKVSSLRGSSCDTNMACGEGVVHMVVYKNLFNREPTVLAEIR